jgi:hypothetical protein
MYQTELIHLQVTLDQLFPSTGDSYIRRQFDHLRVSLDQCSIDRVTLV